MTVTIDPGQMDATSGLSLVIGLEGSSTSISAAGHSQGIPLVIPRSQLYYWSHAWQAGEAAALADLAGGRSRVFHDPRELAKYLLRPNG